MSEYTFSIKKYLTKEEQGEYWKSNIGILTELGEKYCPQVELNGGLPITPAYFDYLRTSWMLDENPEKLAQQPVLSALGFAFGFVLEKSLGLKWALIEDSYGEIISLIADPRGDSFKYGNISIPPFSFVEKRAELLNSDALEDGFNQIKEMLGETSN
ncbi:hypothetical protein [Paraglaciecola sp. 25GB23A]|uniref:hypothetical protein n=1 Tax=Paraglaciecola sp. 25GB23A TaxID=3156068 RepID=UPI0032AE99CD